MVWSSLYLLFLMSVIPQVDGLRDLHGGTVGREQVNSADGAAGAAARSHTPVAPAPHSAGVPSPN